MPQLLQHSSGPDDGRDDPVPRIPVLDLAKRGLLISVVSSCLSVASPIVYMMGVDPAFNATGTPVDPVIRWTAVFVFAAVVAITTTGISFSFQSLIQLRKENGRKAGYKRATVGVVLGAFALLVNLTSGILILFQ